MADSERDVLADRIPLDVGWWTRALGRRNGSDRGMAEFVVKTLRDALAAQPSAEPGLHPDDADAKRRPIQTVGGVRVGEAALAPDRPTPGRGRMKEAEDRFWSKVDAGDCWVWTGSRNGKGYGRVRWNGKNRHAHRVAYECLIGSIPIGLTLDHLCRNPPCVNPAHLEPVTNHENVIRGFGWAGRHASQKRCVNGHDDWQPRTGDRKRRCRTCQRLSHMRPYLPMKVRLAMEAGLSGIPRPARPPPLASPRRGPRYRVRAGVLDGLDGLVERLGLERHPCRRTPGRDGLLGGTPIPR